MLIKTITIITIISIINNNWNNCIRMKIIRISTCCNGRSHTRANQRYSCLSVSSAARKRITTCPEATAIPAWLTAGSDRCLKHSVVYYWFWLSGPIPEVLQYRANPWRERSKPLTSHLCPKISLISKSPNGGRIRY